MKKCVIAPDSFKGSMTSIEVCQIIKQKVAEFFPGCQTVCLPIADGGEGTVDCFLQAMQGEKIMVPVHGPHMEMCIRDSPNLLPLEKHQLNWR